jgi:non-specific serine/threonine protein kinase
LRAAGVLPSSPGAAARAARLAMMERERNNELADVVLEDIALSFELLRLVNSAQVRGAQLSGNGPVLTVRRAIAMLGLDGVRRAALALRDWPGPLDESGAAALQRLGDRCKRAGRVALELRPAGYDSEVVYLITLLQNLGRLVVHYHFADEAQQIRRLMQPAPAAREGDPEDPGMDEEGASFAVLGVDIEAMGNAVARQWGLDEGVIAMIRRHPKATAVHTPDNDDEMLRLLGSCANEVVDALTLPVPRVVVALQRVVSRYGRLLGISMRDLQAALQVGPTGAISSPVSALVPLDEDPT